MVPARPLRLFVAYRDAPERRVALRQPRGVIERYRLFGLDELVERGAVVRHNLEHAGARAWARIADRAINAVLYRLGGYGGDFASIFASLRELNQADVVFSTVDTVGIPLVLLKTIGLVRPPIVYAAIGLPERLVQVRRRAMHRLYVHALGRADVIVSYATSEVEWLRNRLDHDARIVFVPFGVDTHAFQPLPERPPVVDVISIGADPRREFDLLTRLARRRPDLSLTIVTSAERARALTQLPANVALETDVPLERVRDRLADARVVALPVRENSYSGATTVLLQAMAMAKPVVVSRTDAIAAGYGLEDGVNCRLVTPGDADGLERAIVDLLDDPEQAGSIATRARATVERTLSWERYVSALWEILTSVARRTRVPDGHPRPSDECR